MSVARRLAALLLAGGCLFAGAAGAQSPAAPDPNAPPKGDPGLRDPVFRVHGAELGLARHVEMYQWVPGNGGYVRGWSARPVDSGENAGAHANPPFPLASERWLPATVTVDGVPLAPEVPEQLGTWTEFRSACTAPSSGSRGTSRCTSGCPATAATSAAGVPGRWTAGRMPVRTPIPRSRWQASAGCRQR